MRVLTQSKKSKLKFKMVQNAKIDQNHGEMCGRHNSLHCKQSLEAFDTGTSCAFDSYDALAKETKF